jgi:xanthine dehydrogenase accessory factor
MELRRARNIANAMRFAKRNAIALVLGSDEIASAIARALHIEGLRVVLIDAVDPGCPWRGMSFVNAWYFGTADLSGVAACFCSSAKSIPSVIDREGLIAATTWSWQGVAAALRADLLVDARTAKAGGAPDVFLRETSRDFLTIGCGLGFVAPDDVDVAIDTRQDTLAGQVIASGEAPPVPTVSPAAWMTERFAFAPATGRFHTRFSLGDRVAASDELGRVDGIAIAAPLSGVLRAITARGARVSTGSVVGEVDVRDDPSSCYGVDYRGALVAQGVIDAVHRLGIASVRSPSKQHATRSATANVAV